MQKAVIALIVGLAGFGMGLLIPGGKVEPISKSGCKNCVQCCQDGCEKCCGSNCKCEPTFKCKRCQDKCDCSRCECEDLWPVQKIVDCKCKPFRCMCSKKGYSCGSENCPARK